MGNLWTFPESWGYPQSSSISNDGIFSLQTLWGVSPHDYGSPKKWSMDPDHETPHGLNGMG